MSWRFRTNKTHQELYPRIFMPVVHLRRKNIMSSVTRRIRDVILTASMVLIWSATASAQGHWVKLARFPEPAQEIVGTAGNGKVYVFGGLAIGNNTAPKGLAWVYETASDTWTKKKPMPLPAHHLAVTEYRGKVYVFGGGAQVEP